MADRPILFSAPMVRAILAGTKAQTRRVVAHTGPNTTEIKWVEGAACVPSGSYTGWAQDCAAPFFLPVSCPYGAAGDRLWVRETWGLTAGTDETDWHRHSVKGADDRILGHWRPQYRADWGPAQEVCFWRPSIHMPRWASRITLEVVSVRVERLRDISEEDAKAEGSPLTSGSYSHRGWFRELWSEINGTGSWDANPWVWVVEFRRAP